MLNKLKSKLKQGKDNLGFLLFFAPSLSFASSGNHLITVFDNTIDFLSSTLARGVGVTAIVGVGYLYLFQNKIEKQRAVSIVAAIGIILGGPALYDVIAG